MPFEFEENLVRPEIQQGVATTFRIYPTVNGQRVAVEDPASFDILDMGGTGIQSGTVSPANSMFGTRTISRLDIPVGAISKLDEDYIAKIVWTESGETVPRVEVFTFDVVIAPLGESVSISDLQEERPSVGADLDRMGVLLGANAGQEAQEFAARVVAKNARAGLIEWLRSDGDHPRPYMIVERKGLNRIERLIALRELYRGMSRDPEDGEQTADSLFRHYRDESRARFEAFRFVYSTDDDITPDEVKTGIGSSFRTTRIQS